MEEIIKEFKEKVILVAVATEDVHDTEESLDELAELVKTAGAEVAARVIQIRETPHPGTYIGKGKVDEVQALLFGTDATGIVCDDELSPAQISNLERFLDTKVMDRTLVILDIFAKRAFTREGKIQVELAQLKYRASKLTGQGTALSRLGGGIGTRGPGEKKLEMDRRLIRTRISHLKAELRAVVKHREVQRKQRQRNHMPVVCIVGYTNAGKSTLLNYYTDAGVLEENQLFATLDPTTKNVLLDSGQTILMTDTVGFIRKLPHHLVDAFKSTLEEAKYSDLIVHVVDASNPQKDKQMEAVYETLEQLGAKDSTVITAFNKMDLVEEDEILKDPMAEAVVKISGKTGEGTDILLDVIEQMLQKQKLYLEKLYEYNEAGKIQIIRNHGQLIKEEYRDDGIYIEAYIPKEILGVI
ncbi:MULTISPECIES: GTPase HflX [Anaerostipes]|uniref:GTPase HflX n=1 Tax=Anaerostipes TaxID=207244 RepID=UPI0009534C9D|nr:GTPase HflX [Anaerostipes sp. 494a]OLR58784.1 GTPase HflX [Anaerostipes sp. 494a]